MRFYAVPFRGQTVIYQPQRHLAFLGNAALVDYLRRRHCDAPPAADPEIESFLETVGFDRPGLECAPVALPEDELHPTSAVLLLTNRCNLRCVYCYANAGAEPHVAEMDWPTAQATMDFVLDGTDPDGPPPALTFHGGGEPTVHWDLLVRAVEYARARDPHVQISMSSNGVWSEAQRRFVCENFTNVSLSMDGCAAVQDRQRPGADGSETFPAVLDSVRALDEAGVDYGIRMTVLEDSVGDLPEGVRFLCANTRTKAIQVEPTFTSSRGQYADLDQGFADVFSKRFMEAWRIGREAGRHVYYSGARPFVIASLFCQAPLKAAVMTADGRLVTCFEVFSEQSPMAGNFTVGGLREGRVEYDRAALQAFLDAQAARRQECVDCFCYWHCCGDCATRRPGPRSTNEGRCRATRNITLAMLATFLEEGGGVWQGLRETGSAPPAAGDALGPALAPSLKGAEQ